jgi:hypothetical protein
MRRNVGPSDQIRRIQKADIVSAHWKVAAAPILLKGSK